MIIMLARTVYSRSEETDAVEFWFLKRFRLINTNQKDKLMKLLNEASNEDADSKFMEILLLDLNMSIVCCQNPLPTDVIAGIPQKLPSTAYSNFFFLKNDGCFKNLKDLTKIHAIVVYCFRATIVYGIFLNEGMFDFGNSGKRHDSI